MNKSIDFKGQVLICLKERGVQVGRVEQNGTDRSIVIHIPVEENDKVKGFKNEFEETLGVVVAQSTLFGMNVLIVEDAEDED